MADIDLSAEPPRPALQEDRLIVELPLAGPVSKEWNACFTALARADDVPAEVKDSAKNPRIAVTVAPGLELSEQFDATTGYEKSVRNLSWSYASFLSAIRAKTALP